MMMLSRLHSTIAVEITHKLSQHIIMYLGKSSQFFKTKSQIQFFYFLLTIVNSTDVNKEHLIS